MGLKEDAAAQSRLLNDDVNEAESLEFIEGVTADLLSGEGEDSVSTKLLIDQSDDGCETPWQTYREAFDKSDFVYLEVEGVEFELSSSSGRICLVVRLPGDVAARLGLRTGSR
jgi:hypothetical protein